jgi:hypothetical protein
VTRTTRSAIANVLGVLSMIGVASMWAFLYEPKTWNIRFPGGYTAGGLTMVVSIVMSALAGMWGRRIWFVMTAIAIFTFVYIGFFVKFSTWS